MKRKSILIAFGVLLLLGAAYWYFTKKVEEAKAVSTPATEPAEAE